jgi:hypothetical protein
MDSTLTWSDWNRLSQHFRARFATSSTPRKEAQIAAGSTPGAFLSTVRAAILDSSPRHSSVFLHNAKQFRLDTQKTKDEQAGRQLASAKVPCNPVKVMRLNGSIRNAAQQRTPFTLWYEQGAETWLPLRFDYQARSFLRLSFVFDPAIEGSPVPLLLAKESL